MDKYKIDPVPSNKTIKRLLLLPLRCLIVGTSGCGKTTLLYSLIIRQWDLPFYHLYVFKKSLGQDIHQELKKPYEKLIS